MPDTSPSTVWISAREAARILEMTTHLLLTLAAAGRIRTLSRIGPLRFHREDVEKLAADLADSPTKTVRSAI